MGNCLKKEYTNIEDDDNYDDDVDNVDNYIDELEFEVEKIEDQSKYYFYIIKLKFSLLN